MVYCHSITVNSDKSYLEILRKQRVITKIDNNERQSQNVQESIRIDIDSTFTFEKHIHGTCE